MIAGVDAGHFSGRSATSRRDLTRAIICSAETLVTVTWNGGRVKLGERRDRLTLGYAVDSRAARPVGSRAAIVDVPRPEES